MTTLNWDQSGEKVFEAGVDHGVLYIPDSSGVYSNGFAWNGLTTVTESPSGAEANPQYADNIIYLTLKSAELFGATVEAYTYPDEFAQCNGLIEAQPGVLLGQQNRKAFGMSYRTLVGNDVDGTESGFKLHLIYGASAAPSEVAYGTINDSPEAITFSWDLTTIPVAVGTVGGIDYKPVASLTIDSTKVDSSALGDLMDLLYGTVGTDPSLPSPAEVIDLFTGTTTTVTPTAPTFNSGTHVITIPTVTGVIYKIDGVTKTGTVTITVDTVVNAVPAPGYRFPDVTDDDWFFDFV